MDSVTEKLQGKLEQTYDGVWDTPHAFQYLPRYCVFYIIYWEKHYEIYFIQV